MKATKMLKWVIVGSVGTLAACGGVSDIGSGDEEPGMGTGATSSTGAKPGTGSGGAMATGGYEPGTGAKPGMGSGGTIASGGATPGGACMTDFECAVDDVCQMCADGSVVCPKAFCSEGKCLQVGGGCATSCENDMDCPVRDIACTMCDDGSSSCPTTQCVKGQCETSFPGCGNIEPCDGQACGSPCKPCGPDGMCAPDYASYCSAEGKCVPGIPQCGMDPGGDKCETAMDCPSAPPNCVACGNDTCAGFECIENKCVFACPANPEPQCMTTEDCLKLDNDAVCKMCPNGMCAVQACLQNSCELVCKL